MDNMDNKEIPVAKPVVEESKATPCCSNSEENIDPSGTKAVISLILGVLSVLCMGFMTGIPAIIVGQMELKDIRANKSPASGESIAKIGYILGIVGTVLSCLAMLAFSAMIALGISMGGQMTQPV